MLLIILASLTVCLSDIGSLGISQLALMLSKNFSIQTLNISRNLVADQHSTTQLGTALANNSILRELNLQSCGITPLGCAALAAGLANNNTLIRLNLRTNSVGDHGVAALAGVLRGKLAALQWLNLAHNEISPVGVADLADALATNVSLQELNLGNQLPESDVAHELQLSLGRNSDPCLILAGCSGLCDLSGDC